MPKFQIITHGWSCGENIPMPRHSPYSYPNGSDEFSANRRRLKNEILYVLSSGSVTMATVRPFLFCLIFSVCTGTVSSTPVSKTTSLMTEMYQLFSTVIEGYATNFTDCIRPTCLSINYLVCVVLWSTTRKSRTLWSAIRRSYHPICLMFP